jgi:hypothetical protein
VIENDKKECGGTGETGSLLTVYGFVAGIFPTVGGLFSFNFLTHFDLLVYVLVDVTRVTGHQHNLNHHQGKDQ